ncbi:phosphatidylinositol N-acetylglucosaminyltransferase subunit P isoform X2 [Ricinus communis]|uniref:Phosphatidylinositol n-acetylglucosaminyltransferase subunit p, putative n=2 Tax=Ricinus communis TaxID=3988 RepID=B9S357_RICCO|nr:phosphatidylinositol N-acetylglucosaminyltransferase subunit P isoform X2 [Ricinus communis]XP_015575476.1 phosphatidylinositol N-acetylglucosaminyltransferase subunit P isoform X2 [Ricinus communis]XP_015575477.1 phosphatidylinositol N-acetylglucosaminyltransferase subunit P isoform X2 [Ricinus communis]XP_025013357.1 phosphatidylinositol N-acetylglucosaminyltransferase subunit P isoform X2 [Ricinus communis]XP_048226373.1 phosphatidylinositol N-acetylglucosaminyltransferase subunit P isofo|eukprot:XP_002520426.1 phosphatidylinositol N-acetylglucosaminyltransferase subunit P [Ricinus communis]
MEEHYSVNSPRRVLSFSKRKRATVSFLDPDDRASGFGVSGEHGPKTSEVYGFVGSITTIVATVIFLVWAYLPEAWLHSIGIFYYPDRYWALAIPIYAMVTVVLALLFYVGLNFLSTPPAISLSTVYDEFSRDPANPVALTEGEHEQAIEPISDIGISKMNELMFTDVR